MATAQFHNNGGSAKNTRTQQLVVSEIEAQVNEVVDEILLEVTNQNDNSEEIEELEQQEEDDLCSIQRCR